MYNSLASPPRLVITEQPTKQKPSVAWPRLPDEAHVIQMVFGLSEVHEAEAAELPEFPPVSFLHVQAITIALDGEFIRRFWAGVAFDRVDAPLLDFCHDTDVCDARERMEKEQRHIATPWTLRGCAIDDVLDR
jgi:hypothetical protein